MGDPREERVRELLPLVRAIARRVHRMVPTSDLADLVGDGCIGLIRAIDTFDPARGPTLRGYAGKLVLGTMLNGLRRMDPLSERVRSCLRQAERERYRTAVCEGRMPSHAEMLRRYPRLETWLESAQRALPLSLDAPLPAGESVAADSVDDPAVVATERAERAYLRALIDSLPERQRRLVLAHYYGSVSLRRIGRAFAISSQRASQLHAAAIARLRARIDAAARRI